MPSAILSILTIIAIYFLVQDFFFSYKHNKELELTTSFLLAINPWHIYISRLGHEGNAAVAFFIFALFFFFRKKLFLSILFASLSFMSYQSEKIFIPLIAITILIFFYNEIKKN